MLKLFCKIIGDDYKILATETPESRKKVIAQGTVIFIPVIIWFIIGFLVSTKIMQLNTGNGLLIGFILGLLIFILERTIIMAHGKSIINWFRVILGIVIATLGAIFLDEIIFAADIDHQIAINQEAKQQHLIDSISKKYDELITVSEMRVVERYDDWYKSVHEVAGEADGTGGSGRVGTSSVTTLKKGIAADLKIQYNDELFRRDSLLLEKTKMINLVSDKKNEPQQAGILIRVRALFQLVFSDWIMALIYVLFTLFLFSMEFLVVLIKAGWRKTNYERRLEMMEEIRKRRMEMMMKQHAQLNPAEFHPNYENAKKYFESNSASKIFS